MNTATLPSRLAEFLLKQQSEEKLADRNEKLKRILLLLSKGAVLAAIIALPKTGKLFKGFLQDQSDWQEWKMFNRTYLRRTINRLAKQKIIEIDDHGDFGTVKITEKGQRKVFQFGINALHIDKPSHWDHKWRLVSYDIFSQKKSVRDRFQIILHNAGFYPFQESLYLHAYPCETQIEFLRHFLGIDGEVRLIIAEKIEDDQIFRDYFGV